MPTSDPTPVDAALRQYEEGDAAGAFAALKALAESGNDAAFPILGYLYDVGEGTRKNTKRAIHWYEQGYKAGSSMCASNLATIYRDAGDARKEFKWYQRGAAMDDGDAQVEVAIRLLTGKGVRRDLKEAIRLLEQVQKMSHTSEAGQDTARQLLWGCRVGKPKRK